MKVIKLSVILTALFAVAISSCSDDVLREKRDLTGYNEQVYQDSLLAQAYVDYVYFLFRPGSGANAPIYSREFGTTTSLCEESPGQVAYLNNFLNGGDIAEDYAQAPSYFGAKMGTSVGNNTWTRIRQINLFLSNIDLHGEGHISKDWRNKLKGQLYYWRAVQYFELVRMYGGVPIIKEAQNAITTSDEELEALQTPRSSTSDCIDFICQDLDSAVSMLPSVWPDATTQYGRITKGAAAGQKGRVLLTYASPQFNPNDDQTRWQRAYTACNEANTICLAAGNGLFTAKAWRFLFTDENHKEVVNVMKFNEVTTDLDKMWNGWEKSCRPKEISGGGSINPSMNIMESFPMLDGKLPGQSSKYVYDSLKFYKNRDPRFYGTFAYNGAKWAYNDDNKYVLWTYKWYEKSSTTLPNKTHETAGANSTGVYVCKATRDNAKKSDFTAGISGTDFIEMRYAEILLNFAETQVGINQLEPAVQILKDIRKRAGIEAGSDNMYGLKAGMNRNELFAAILNERKVEFAYENLRFWDLRRWKLFTSESGTCDRLGLQPINGMRRKGMIISVKKSAVTYSGSSSLADPIATKVLEGRDLTGNAYNTWLDNLYNTYFELIVNDEVDPTKQTPNWTFQFPEKNYFFGLKKDILNICPYLEQTQGWTVMGTAGTFDPLQ